MAPAMWVGATIMAAMVSGHPVVTAIEQVGEPVVGAQQVHLRVPDVAGEGARDRGGWR